MHAFAMGKWKVHFFNAENPSLLAQLHLVMVENHQRSVLSVVILCLTLI